jgi:hypothetical protein
MRKLFSLAVYTCFCLTSVSVCSQIAEETLPSNDEAKSACLTLERLLVIQRNKNQVQNAVALYRAYNLVHQYVTDLSALKNADDYIQYFGSHYSTVTNVSHVDPSLGGSLNPPPGNFRWMPADPMANDLVSDQNHQTGVVVYGRNGSAEYLHFALDKDSVTKMLRDKGAVAAESARP